MELKKINQIVDIFTDYTTGIFYALKSIASGDSFAWLDNSENLDIMYYSSHSGEKYASRFYLTMLEHNKTISDIANIVFTKFSDKWKRVYDAMIMEYNPINNYDMQEKETVNSKITSTIDVDNKTHGFGSTTAVPTDEGKSTTTTEGDADDNVRELTRSGNIGVTTSAQLLAGELEVRKNIFIEEVMKDIDTMLCLKIY